MKINLSLFNILFILILSCDTYQKSQFIKSSGQDEAIFNIVMDFSTTQKNSENRVFTVRKDEESKDLYSFSISESFKVFVQSKDSIGASPKYFPTRFKEVNNRLFVWQDSTAKISKEVIQKFHQYSLIDSTIYKINAGKLPADSMPYITTNDLKKAVFYYVCKDNIEKFKKINTNKVLSISKYPVVNCNK